MAASITPATLSTPLQMRPNADFNFAFYLKDANGNPINNLSGYSATMRILPAQTPQKPLDFSTQNSRVTYTFDGTNYWFNFKLLHTDTATQTWTGGTWNVLIKDPTGAVNEYLNGTITLLPALALTPV